MSFRRVVVVLAAAVCFFRPGACLAQTNQTKQISYFGGAAEDSWDNSMHSRVAISGDGRYVVFCTAAGLGGLGRVYVADRSVDPATLTQVFEGIVGGNNEFAARPDISGDG